MEERAIALLSSPYLNLKILENTPRSVSIKSALGYIAVNILSRLRYIVRSEIFPTFEQVPQLLQKLGLEEK